MKYFEEKKELIEWWEDRLNQKFFKRCLEFVKLFSKRHTFASQLAIQGTPIYTIMRLMDHSDISQTIKRAKLSPDSAKNAVFVLDL